MRNSFFGILLFIPFVAFSYSAKNVKLSQSEYTRWVKPQLKSITLDYQKLLMLVNPNLVNIKETFSHFKELSERNDQFIGNCKKLAKASCQEIVNKNIETIGKILIATESTNLRSDPYLSFKRESTLQTFRLHQNFQQSLMDLYFEYINFSFFYSSNIPTLTSPISLVTKQAQNFNQYNFYVLSNTDPRFFEAFSEFWNGFIKPVKTILLAKKDKSHYVRRLNDLNLRWNLLHVELAKRNKKVPNGVSSLLTTMHNRWKMSLRVTLR